jgi:hypothetical protein
MKVATLDHVGMERVRRRARVALVPERARPEARSYHLAHQFRVHTGTSVHQFVADLHTAAALRRIEALETSLAVVA